jgi:hypothetical protein
MEDVRTNLRIPGELYEQIKALAAANLRSINNEMIVLLREALAARKGNEQKPAQK